jgi:hypothetical protein
MPIQPRAPIAGSKSLELTMRDVLEGLADSASQLAYGAAALNMEILSRESPRAAAPQSPRATVVMVTAARSQNVVDYLMRRESRLEHQAVSA